MKSINTQKISIVSDVSTYKEALINHPLFKNINGQPFNNLIDDGILKKFGKGTQLLMQGEKAQNLHIILTGLVKVGRSSDGGNEAVPQILGVGDTFTEAFIFQEILSPVSAEALKETLVFCLPKDTVINAISTNSTFTMNLMSLLSTKSAELISHIEQVTTRSALDRTGNFLLRTFIADGDGKSVTLPISRTLLANHLAMTPETLSRSLRQLKSDGVHIDGSKITLPNPKALCKFCDVDIIRACNKGTSNNCPASNLLKQFAKIKK